MESNDSPDIPDRGGGDIRSVRPPFGIKKTPEEIKGGFSDTDLATKLWGPARQLQRTADSLAATELRI